MRDKPNTRQASVFVGLYALNAVALTGLLILVNSRERVLVVLAIPIFFAAISYPRSVYLCMGAIAAGVSVWGIVNLASDLRASFAILFTAIASTLALAELIHLFNRARGQAEETEHKQRILAEALADTATALNSTLELDEVLDRVLENVGRVVPHDLASIMFIEEGMGRVIRHRSVGEHRSADIGALRFPVAEIPNLKRMIESKQPCVIADVQVDPGWVKMPGQEWLRAYVGAPILIEGEPIGFVHLSSALPSIYQEKDGWRLQVFADQAAIAIRNAQLHTREREQRQIAELLLETGAVLASSLALGEVLLTLARRLVEVSGFQICELYEWEQAEGQVRALVEYACCVWPPGGGESYALDSYASTRHVLGSGEAKILYPGMAEPDEAELAWMERSGQAAIIMLPLRANEAIIGLAEVGGPDSAFVHRPEAIGACEEVIARFAGRIRAPLASNPHEVLIELAEQLIRAGGGTSCALSDWEREEGVVRSAVYVSESKWEKGVGWAYALADHSAFVAVLEEGKPIIGRVGDPGTDASEQAEMTRWGERVMVLLPLRAGGVLNGLVKLSSAVDKQPILEKDIRLWQAIADQAAIAIRNAALYGESQKRIEQLALINRITRIGAAVLAPDELLQTLADMVAPVVGGDGAYITLWDAENRRTIRGAAYGPYRNSYKGPTPLGEQTLTESVLKVGHALAIPDALNSPYVSRRIAERYSARSLLGVPLQADGRDIGALIFGFDQPHVFKDEEIEWATQVGELVALAIAKAQAYAELERRVTERTAELRDVTERLLELGRLKDEFVANVSHELRTPITSLKLFHRLLRVQPEKRENYLGYLDRETARLELIIEDLLYLSRLDRGEVQVNKALVNINESVGQLVRDRQVLARERQLTLMSKLDTDAPSLLADAKLLRRAVDILLINAFNYTPAGGMVMVRTGMQEREGRQWIVVQVSDTGPGIKAEEMPHLFERFFRGEVGRQSGVPGTGLGLAIVKEIVERHAGWIEAESEGIPGRGVTFSIWLPKAESSIKGRI